MEDYAHTTIPFWLEFGLRALNVSPLDPVILYLYGAYFFVYFFGRKLIVYLLLSFALFTFVYQGPLTDST